MPWMRQLPNRRERRIWVSVLFLGMIAEDALLVALKTSTGSTSLWARIVGVIGFLSVMLVWNRLERWSVPVIPESALAPTPSVDERQQAVRDQSFRRAYQAMFRMVLVSAVAGYVFQDDLLGLLRRISELKLLFLAIAQIIILLATLPVACLAWTEPDESDGKPVEEMSRQESSAAGF
jgi:H+/gluconate symporter-like permease